MALRLAAVSRAAVRARPSVTIVRAARSDHLLVNSVLDKSCPAAHHFFPRQRPAYGSVRLFSSSTGDSDDGDNKDKDESAATGDDNAAENVDPEHDVAFQEEPPMSGKEAAQAVDDFGDNYDFDRFAFREQPQRNPRFHRKGRGGRPGGGRGFDRPKRDPETGFEDGGRLRISLDGRMKENSGFVPLAMRDTIYRMHKEDPQGKGALLRLAQQTGLRVMKIQGIIKLREEELRIEKEQGFPLDQKLDQLARSYFGEKKNWRGEFDKTEKEARVAAATSGRWTLLQPNEEMPKMRKFGEATSLGGFFKEWKKKPKYQGEEVIKVDDRFVFLRVKKTKKKRLTLI